MKEQVDDRRNFERDRLKKALENGNRCMNESEQQRNPTESLGSVIRGHIQVGSGLKPNGGNELNRQQQKQTRGRKKEKPVPQSVVRALLLGNLQQEIRNENEK